MLDCLESYALCCQCIIVYVEEVHCFFADGFIIGVFVTLYGCKYTPHRANPFRW